VSLPSPRGYPLSPTDDVAVRAGSSQRPPVRPHPPSLAVPCEPRATLAGRPDAIEAGAQSCMTVWVNPTTDSGIIKRAEHEEVILILVPSYGLAAIHRIQASLAARLSRSKHHPGLRTCSQQRFAPFSTLDRGKVSSG
jgi:hypothetical protein